MIASVKSESPPSGRGHCGPSAVWNTIAYNTQYTTQTDLLASRAQCEQMRSSVYH